MELSGDAASIRLRVVDDGTGFDLASLDGKPGLGLISMRERVRLVHGEFVIDSRPAGGTRVEVRVPVGSHGQPTVIDLKKNATPVG